MIKLPLRCADCDKEVPFAISKEKSQANSTGELKLANGSANAAANPANASSEPSTSVEFWWCRDCVNGICKSCHLLKGHTEHRTNVWKPEEIYKTCVQALEGRCSRRGRILHEQKIAVKEFLAKVEVILLNELVRHLEHANDPDRKLISRLNREITTIELKDDRPPLYHVPSPSRPAWKTWNLDQEDPKRMAEVIDMASELLQLPREEHYEDEQLQLKDRSEWSARHAAELVGQSIGARIAIDSTSMFSRATTPDRKSTYSSEDGGRRRGNSVDSARAKHVQPLEPNIFVRDRPSVMSFRERSIPLDETPNDSIGSPAPSHASFETKSVFSSLPAYDQSLGGSGQSGSASAITPTPIMNGRIAEEDQNYATPTRPPHFGSQFLTRPICVQAFQTKHFKQSLAISDSCGGVYVTNMNGQIKDHITVKNSSASSIAIDEKNEIMYVSIMTSKGRSVYLFDIANNFKKMDSIPCPKDPKIETSRTRWLCVGPRGQLFMVSGDNVKSALWCYIRGRKGWKTLKESRKTRYQYLSVAEDQADYKAVVLLTCDAANNRLLLFVVDHSISLINEYDLSKTYQLQNHITSPASAIVDGHGNLLVLDYATGKLFILLSGVKGVRRLKQVHFPEPLLPQEALGISVAGDDVIVACFNRREIRYCTYLENGQFRPSQSGSLSSQTQSPIVSNNKRSTSLPRPNHQPNESEL